MIADAEVVTVGTMPDISRVNVNVTQLFGVDVNFLSGFILR